MLKLMDCMKNWQNTTSEIRPLHITRHCTELIRILAHLLMRKIHWKYLFYVRILLIPRMIGTSGPLEILSVLWPSTHIPCWGDSLRGSSVTPADPFPYPAHRRTQLNKIHLKIQDTYDDTPRRGIIDLLSRQWLAWPVWLPLWFNCLRPEPVPY